MFLRILARLASIFLASTAATVPVTVAINTLSSTASAQETSGLSAVDCSVVSAAQLEAVVSDTVDRLRLAGFADADIAQELGRELKLASTSCTAAQQQALIVNVVQILSMELSVTTAQLLEQVSVGYGSLIQPTVVEEARLQVFDPY